MSSITEKEIENFWNLHPCGTDLIPNDSPDLKHFFDRYDQFRYETEGHILRCLDELPLKGKNVLEVGLGQGADSEQIIRRGGTWAGIDPTEESTSRVRARLTLKNLPFTDIKRGSVTALPWPDNSFDVVYSHGVLHHVPQIHLAQKEIARVLKPGGLLVAMLYARNSLNYWVAISWVRRLALFGAYALGIKRNRSLDNHLQNAHRLGLFNYLRMNNFIHANTDGPLNPYSKVYDVRTVRNDFPAFRIEKIWKEFMHAPPLPVHHWPGASLVGWHLWAWLRKQS